MTFLSPNFYVIYKQIVGINPAMNSGEQKGQMKLVKNIQKHV
jgi:hypothetical protein